MAMHCQAGDTPTVYYSFGNQSQRQNVTFHLSPIDVQLTTAQEEAADQGQGDGTVREPCPAAGTLCSFTYSATFRFGDNYGYEPGQVNEFYPRGWIFRETYLSFMYEGDDTWEFNYSDFAFIWRVEAIGTYRFSDSVIRPSPPQYYQDLIDDENGLIVGDWSLRDSCFPKGGSPQTCYKGTPPPPPPPPPPDKDQCIIKVLHNNKEIWRANGKCPASYNVSCKKDKCPDGFLKLKANNPKGFCCIPCKELQFETSQIKSLLRR